MFSMYAAGSGDDAPPDRPTRTGSKRRRNDELGHRLPTEQKRDLYKLCKTSWTDMKPGQRVLELQRVLAQKPVREALLKWLRDFSERRQTAKPLEDPDSIVAYAFKMSKDGVAIGRSIDEAVSHWTADAVFKLQPRGTFAHIKFQITKAVRSALA